MMGNMLTQLLKLYAQRKKTNILRFKYDAFCGEFSYFLCFHGVSSHSMKTSRSSNWEAALLKLSVICPVDFVAFKLNHFRISSRPPVIQREHTHTLSFLLVFSFVVGDLFIAHHYHILLSFSSIFPYSTGSGCVLPQQELVSQVAVAGAVVTAWFSS